MFFRLIKLYFLQKCIGSLKNINICTDGQMNVNSSYKSFILYTVWKEKFNTDSVNLFYFSRKKNEKKWLKLGSNPILIPKIMLHVKYKTEFNVYNSLKISF